MKYEWHNESTFTEKKTMLFSLKKLCFIKTPCLLDCKFTSETQVYILQNCMLQGPSLQIILYNDLVKTLSNENI